MTKTRICIYVYVYLYMYIFHHLHIFPSFISSCIVYISYGSSCTSISSVRIFPLFFINYVMMRFITSSLFHVFIHHILLVRMFPYCKTNKIYSHTGQSSKLLTGIEVPKIILRFTCKIKFLSIHFVKYSISIGIIIYKGF